MKLIFILLLFFSPHIQCPRLHTSSLFLSYATLFVLVLCAMASPLLIFPKAIILVSG